MPSPTFPDPSRSQADRSLDVYRPVDAPKLLTFGEAMNAVLKGARVTRLSWVDPTSYLFLRAGILHLHKGHDHSEHVLKVSDGDLAGTDWIAQEGDAR